LGSIGVRVGLKLSEGAWEIEGATDGARDGRRDGREEGTNEGMPEGCNEGTREVLGVPVGARDGLRDVEGAADGAPDGRRDGREEGTNEGVPVGCNEGTREVLGAADEEGWSDGASDWVGGTEGMEVEGDVDTSSSNVVKKGSPNVVGSAASTLLLLALFFVCGAYTTSTMIRVRARAINAHIIPIVVERR
jgi:hypothetical protein